MNEKKIELSVPISFWSKILMQLDQKIQTMAVTKGFGSVSLEIRIKEGKIVYITWDDKVGHKHDQVVVPL